MQRLMLVGGGHAHLAVLHALAKHRPDIEVKLITPGTHQTYSGMLPGWMAGHYSLSECQIDLRPLALKAGVELVSDHVTGMDADRRRIFLANGMQFDYDLVSIDVGGESNLSWLGALGDRLLPLKPLGEFVRRWPRMMLAAAQRKQYSLIVVGGGAAGVEIALAARCAFSNSAPDATVTLIASEKGVLPGHAPAVAARVRALLQQRGIALHEAHAVGVEDGVLLGNGLRLHADTVVAATGSVPPPWLQTSQLSLDEHGNISVDATHRSLAHPEVFAAGDVCARRDTAMARSGVHAVFAGPVVAHNLIASIERKALVTYRPRKRSLYLLATGPKHAIASWGAFSASGHWVWRWKNWIDRRFMDRQKIEAYRHD